MNTSASLSKHETPPVARTERVRSGPTFAPVVDIVERPDRLLLIADMPGVAADALDITYERGALTIRGCVAPRSAYEHRNLVLNEYGVGDFERSFEIGEGVDSNRIEAELQDGVLTLHLPKSPELTPRKIAVKAN
ncbi:MAG: Hsp20/alpha crystallin family protein [Phycisphaerae bacterium]